MKIEKKKGDNTVMEFIMSAGVTILDEVWQKALGVQ